MSIIMINILNYIAFNNQVILKKFRISSSTNLMICGLKSTLFGHFGISNEILNWMALWCNFLSFVLSNLTLDDHPQMCTCPKFGFQPFHKRKDVLWTTSIEIWFNICTFVLKVLVHKNLRSLERSIMLPTMFILNVSTTIPSIFSHLTLLICLPH